MFFWFCFVLKNKVVLFQKMKKTDVTLQSGQNQTEKYEYEYTLPLSTIKSKSLNERRIKYNALPVIPLKGDYMLSKTPSGHELVVTTTWKKMGDTQHFLSVENVQTRPAKPQLDGTVFSPPDDPEHPIKSLRVNEKFLPKNKKEEERKKKQLIDSRVENKVRCALCEYKFSKDNLPYKITYKAIYKKRDEWGLKLDYVKEKWNSGYMYGETHICKFCSQLFQPKMKNIILPDPASIFEKEEPPILKNKKEIDDDDDEYNIYNHFDEFYYNLRKDKYEYNSFLKHFLNKTVTNLENVDVEIPTQFIPTPPPTTKIKILKYTSKESKNRNRNKKKIISQPLFEDKYDREISVNDYDNEYYNPIDNNIKPTSPISSFRYSMRRSSYKSIVKPLSQLKRPKTSREIHKKCIVKSIHPYVEQPPISYLKNTEYYREINFNRAKSPYNVKMKCLKPKF